MWRNCEMYYGLGACMWVWRVADLSLTGPLALPFAFFHRLDTPVLPHFISPHISLTTHISFKYFHNSDCRWQIPSKTPSHFTSRSQILTDLLTPHRFLTDFDYRFLTDLSWLPRVSPRHPTSPQCFQLWCIIEPGCDWWPQILILPGKLQIFSQTTSFAWWKESVRNL